MNKDIHEKMKTILLGTLTVGVIAGISGNIVYDYSINRNRKFFFGPTLWKNDSMTRGQFLRTDVAEEALHWAERTEISELNEKAFDGVALHGYSFMQKKHSNLWVIAVHGYAGMASQMFPVAKIFYERGFNVLLPECRGSGKSGGNCFGMGWLDRNDILKWTYQIIDKDPDARIVYYGVSTGADAVMMAAGESLPSNVRCVIEDSGYSDLIGLYNHHFERHSIPWFPLHVAASFVTRIRAGYSFFDASAINQVAKSKTPILFIHGGRDKEVPSEMVYQLYNATNCVKDILVIPEASHAYAMYVEPELYWKKIWDFTDRFIDNSEEERDYRSKIMGQINKIRGK